MSVDPIVYIVVGVVNLIIFFAIYCELKEYKRMKRLVARKRENLLQNRFHFKMNEEELFMLNSLAKLNKKTANEYLRSQIKEVCKNGTVDCDMGCDGVRS